MRMSIGVPGISVYFEHHQVKPFVKDHSRKAKQLFHERVVPVVIRSTCRVLEVIANNTADAHDYLIGKLKSKQSA
jgi:phosphopantothenate synthetase